MSRPITDLCFFSDRDFFFSLIAVHLLYYTTNYLFISCEASIAPALLILLTLVPMDVPVAANVLGTLGAVRVSRLLQLILANFKN